MILFCFQCPAASANKPVFHSRSALMSLFPVPFCEISVNMHLALIQSQNEAHYTRNCNDSDRWRDTLLFLVTRVEKLIDRGRMVNRHEKTLYEMHIIIYFFYRTRRKLMFEPFTKEIYREFVTRRTESFSARYKTMSRCRSRCVKKWLCKYRHAVSANYCTVQNWWNYLSSKNRIFCESLQKNSL